MLSYSDVETPGTFVQGGATLNGGTGTFYTFTWIATARPAENFTGTKGSKVDVSTRTCNTVFARGLKEKISISTRGNTGWQWRRICFTLKGDAITAGNSDPNTSDYFRITSIGMVRLVHQDPDGSTIEKLFRGQQSEDWDNVMIAPVDTRNVTVKYDKVRTINSGNSQGVTRFFNLWHAMNKNVMYEDEESGDAMFTSPLSVESKGGMGDYYVVDFFINNFGGTTGTDALIFNPNATFYWHEK